MKATWARRDTRDCPSGPRAGALAGSIGAKNGLGLQLASLLLGYTLGFAVIGRPENIFWGLMTAPLIAVGLCFAPTALVDLVRRAVGRAPASESIAGKTASRRLEQDGRAFHVNSRIGLAGECR